MALELADIFRQYAPAYRQKYAAHLLASHRQAMRAIERCRTQALGGQLFACPACGEVRYSYHSCRNRHCPKCQHQQTQDWLEVQQGLLLDVPYFLLTFTLPSELRQFASQNQKLIYNLLFRASAQATQQLARDPRFVGGQIGMLGVLHTWTRNLAYHPHVHYLVPGGGVGSDGNTWLPARRDFFLPVKALSKLFRAALQRALRRTALYTQIPSKVWQRAWVVHCKPVGNGQAALKYLAPTSTVLPSATDAWFPSIIVAAWKLPKSPSNTAPPTMDNSRPVCSLWSISSSASSSTSCHAAS
jgi:hypothetical protein